MRSVEWRSGPTRWPSSVADSAAGPPRGALGQGFQHAAPEGCDADRGTQLASWEVPDRPTDPPQVCLLGVQDVEDDLATFATAAARAFSKLTTGCRLRRAIEGNPAPFQESGEADKLRLADR